MPVRKPAAAAGAEVGLSPESALAGYLEQKDWERAETYHERARRVAEALQSPRQWVPSLLALGDIALAKQDPARARVYFSQAKAIAQADRNLSAARDAETRLQKLGVSNSAPIAAPENQ